MDHPPLTAKGTLQLGGCLRLADLACGRSRGLSWSSRAMVAESSWL